MNFIGQGKQQIKKALSQSIHPMESSFLKKKDNQSKKCVRYNIRLNNEMFCVV